MNMTEIENAVRDAGILKRRIEIQSKALARLLKGNLRAVNRDHMWDSGKLLGDLKKELSQYNARTHQWKN